MSDVKTFPTGASVAEFLAGVTDDRRRADCLTLVEMMSEITGEHPVMWGPSMVGFGTYRYRYASGREGDWFLTGFSPRKRDLTVYVMAGFDRYEDLMARLGKHGKGKSCLYLKGLADIDVEVLEELVRVSVERMRRAYA